MPINAVVLVYIYKYIYVCVMSVDSKYCMYSRYVDCEYSLFTFNNYLLLCIGKSCKGINKSINLY